jgi:hypothetical protein
MYHLYVGAGPPGEGLGPATGLVGDEQLWDRMIHLSSAWGGLGVSRLPVLAAFVGPAALIGPAVKALKGLIPGTDIRSAVQAFSPCSPSHVADPLAAPDAGGLPVDDDFFLNLSVDTMPMYDSSRRKVQAWLPYPRSSVR